MLVVAFQSAAPLVVQGGLLALQHRRLALQVHLGCQASMPVWVAVARSRLQSGTRKRVSPLCLCPERDSYAGASCTTPPACLVGCHT